MTRSAGGNELNVFERGSGRMRAGWNGNRDPQAAFRVKILIRDVLGLTRGCLQKARRPRRYDRSPAEGDLHQDWGAWLANGYRALLDWLDEAERWDRIRTHLALAHPERAVQQALGRTVDKALSLGDLAFFAELLADFFWFGERSLTEKAAAIVALHHFAAYADAARFALGKLGVVADFDLRNEAIRDLIWARRDAAVFAGRSGIDRACAVIVEHLFELGDGPTDTRFLDALQDALGYEAEWQALRFAQTEIGIVTEQAQRDVYTRSGVEAKAWRHSGRATGRPGHIKLDGVTVGIHESFRLEGADGQVYACAGPLDPALPVGEVVNCGCTTDPVFREDQEFFTAWTGA